MDLPAWTYLYNPDGYVKPCPKPACDRLDQQWRFLNPGRLLLMHRCGMLAENADVIATYRVAIGEQPRQIDTESWDYPATED